MGRGRFGAVIATGLPEDEKTEGCGRKEKLTPPRGADYPRQYPRE